MKKITVIGAGNVGATAAHTIAKKDFAEEIVLIDVAEGIPQGKALDMWESSPVELFNSRIIGTNDYKESKNSEIIIITAGLPRKPGMSRDDLLAANTDIMKSVVEKAVEYSPQAIIIVVSNPLDVMAYVAKTVSGFERRRIIGMAGILDSARFRLFIAKELGISTRDIQAMTLGGHGDSMVPLVNYSTVSGIPISQLISKERIDKLVERTKNGGIEIVNLLKTGSAFYAPAASAVEIAEAIAKNSKRILPCSVYCAGEYGLNDVFCGVPVLITKNGAEKIIELKLSSEEAAALKASADDVKKNIEKIRLKIR
ncbi:MAG TPA: malate dehydrogenase [Ignavibacteriales bacterium]|nr:malate dehydrogenase [Ignavibacteriales bacterium]HEX3072974.1 malate dehydrogenase [Ignavibacteriales bacterium]